MTTDNLLRAADIYSHPASGNRPARHGLLPIGRTQFYALLKRGDIPQPDAQIGNTRLWSMSILRSAVRRHPDSSAM
jgi:hypothetical protein